MLERALRGQGIDVLCNRTTTAIHDDRVELSSGEVIEAQLVIVAAGVTPEVELARRIGLEVGRGVLVDDSLRTSLPGVWAVGECAEHRGAIVGLVAPALAMARAAGADIAGKPASYIPAPVSTKLKVAGIDLFCSGELEADDEVIALDTRAGYYRREVYRGSSVGGPDRPRRSARARGRREGPGRVRVPQRHALADPGRADQGRDGLRLCARAVASILEEAAEVGFQAVQVEGAKAIEVIVRRPVKVG